MGAGIGSQIVEQIAEVDIDHVAQRYQVGEADTADLSPVEDRGDDGAGLSDERQPAGQCGQVCEAGIEAGGRAENPHAIGADQAHAVALRRGEQCGAARCLCGIAAEARGQDHRGAGSARAELVECRRDRCRGNGDHGEVRHQRQR